MIRIGLTGSIGSGKSSVARAAAEELGIAIFDADKAVHDLYAHDKELQSFLVGKAGAAILKDGDIDRQELAKLMRDGSRQTEWREIEAEVHRCVWKAYDNFVKEQEAKGAKYIIGDVPRLFETNAESHFDYTVNVFLPYDVQKRRALARQKPKLTEEEFEKRFKSFIPPEQRNKRADFTIDNSGEIEASVLQLQFFLQNMRDPQAPAPLSRTFNKAAVYVGSFDPPTLGHIDVVKSASIMPDKLYVAVGINPAKKPMFTVEERMQMIEREIDRDVRPYLTAGQEIIVTSYEGLTVDFMKKVGAAVCIRGLRGVKDLEEEGDLAAVNKGLFNDNREYGDTLNEPGADAFIQHYIPSDPARRHVSSTMARELCRAGRDVSLLKFVSPDVAVKMIEKRELTTAYSAVKPDELKKIQALWQEFAPQAGELADKNFKRLLRKYGEFHRRYHTSEHLAEVFVHFEKNRAAFRDPQAVALALFFHDAIYEIRGRDNEERSARFAREVLTEMGAEADLANRVAELVAMTKNHTASASDTDAALMMDIDMAILGASRERYKKYAADVEAEYTSRLTQQEYRAGRQHFLGTCTGAEKGAKKRFFITDAFEAQFGDQSRRNLAWELNQLTKSQATVTPRSAPKP